MKVLITGGTGQLGAALQRTKPHDIDVAAPARDKLDLVNTDGLAKSLDSIGPQAVINAAAYTDVDGAEKNWGPAYQINAEAPGILAAWCAQNSARLIHISTDFVFGGQPAYRPILPDTPVAPISVYGETKAAGEEAVRLADPDATILRTSWLYGPRFGTGFVDRMLRRAISQPDLSAVTDQVGSPTSSTALARILWRCLASSSGQGRTHHAVCNGAVSRYDLAAAALAIARSKDVVFSCRELRPATSDTFPTPARRPAYSALDPTSLEAMLGIAMPNWTSALADHIESVLPALKKEAEMP